MMPLDPMVGGTVLRIPAIQSPNFVSGVSGWAIFQNGDAQFNSITIPPGSGGATVYIQATAPATANTGDLWYDTSNGMKLSQWNGSAWVAYQIGTGAIASGSITAPLIAANTITAAQLAAGIVYAGIVDSTTINAATFTGSVFEGTDFIINTSGAFYYSGTPATGNLVISIARVAGTDGFSNPYKAGVCVYNTTNGSVTQLNNGGVFLYDASGNTYSITPSVGLGVVPVGLTIGGSVSGGQSPNIPILQAVAPGSNVTDDWHNFTLASGWSVGTDSNSSSYIPQYKMLPDGSVAIRGCVQTPSSGTVLGVAFTTIPSGYAPASGSNIPTATVTQASGAHTGTIEIHPNGNVELQGAFLTSNNIRLDCRILVAG